MKFLKRFAYVSLFVVSLFILTSNTASAGFCKIATSVNGNNSEQNAPCAGRPQYTTGDEIGCTEEPYFHLRKVMTCVWDTGTNPNNPPYPLVVVSATPPSISSGGMSNIEWETSNVNSCKLNGVNVSPNGSQNVYPIVTTTYTVSCTGTNGPASDSATVTVSSNPPLVVNFRKNPDNIKNIIKNGSPDAIGTVYFKLTITGLNGTGRNCEYLENGQPITPQKKWEADTYISGETFSRSNLNANSVTSTIVCKNSDGGTIYATGLNTKTQSVTIGGANNSCLIPPNSYTCTVPINWTTTNPYPGNTAFPTPVTTSLTVNNGTQIDGGNTGNDITINAQLIGSLGQKMINFNNNVDDEGNTATNFLAPVLNVMKSQIVSVSCQTGTGWTSVWDA